MSSNYQSVPPPNPTGVPSMPTIPAPVTSYTSPYLPDGTPPWPTTVLQRPSLPSSNTQAVSNTKVAQRKAGATRNTFITLGIIALTLLVGVGLTYGTLYFNGQLANNTARTTRTVSIAKATAQPTTAAGASTPSSTSGSLPAPTSFSSMRSDHQKSIGVFVKYPSDWIEEPSSPPTSSGTVVAIFHPQQAIGIVVYVGKFSASASGVSTTDALNQGLISTIYSGSGNTGNTNLQAVQPTTPHRTIGGEQWNELDATFSDPNGVLMHVASIAIKHASFFYCFIYQTPDIYYNDVLQKYVPPMLDSFKFLS